MFIAGLWVNEFSKVIVREELVDVPHCTINPLENLI
nr:MAG TPA: hypothetical protein [Caudoviricetes sp.]